MLYLDTFGAFGGVGRCTIELLPCLAKRLGHVTLAGRSHVVDSYGASLFPAQNLSFWNLERPRFHPSAWALRGLAETRPLSLSYTHALLDRARLRSRGRQPVLINYPQVLTPPTKAYEFDLFLHDLNWRHFPENSPDPDGVDRRCKEWVRQARRVFTNSDFTRQDVIALYDTNPERVISAPLAPPSLPTPSKTDDKLDRLSSFGLKPNGYFFYPSVIGHHKGHEVLAAALAEDSSTILPVVITGVIAAEGTEAAASGPRSLATVRRKLDDLRRAGKIISLPALPWADVLLVAEFCRAYVLPSRFEGYGFPLAEAMALGKPSLCSDIPAFTEILNRYGPKIQATTFPSGDEAALRELLIGHSSWDAPSTPETARPDLSTCWSWDDTANAIAEGLKF